jgi:hypothetical protein
VEIILVLFLCHVSSFEYECGLHCLKQTMLVPLIVYLKNWGILNKSKYEKAQIHPPP